MTLVFLAALAAVATGFVLQPVFADPGRAPAAPDLPPDRRALRLDERRRQLLLAIAELDFERDAGKVGADEHRAARAALLEEAAAVTEALDAPGDPPGEPPGDRKDARRRAARKQPPAEAPAETDAAEPPE